jgi:hypothetical protein
MTTLAVLTGSFCALATVMHFASIVVVIARRRKADAGEATRESRFKFGWPKTEIRV